MEANVKPHIILTILHPVISLRYARLRVFSDLWLKSISHTRFEQLEANNKFSLSFSINLCGFDEYDQAHEYGNNEVLILGWSAEDVAPMSFKFFMENRPIGARKLWITQYKLIVQLILKKVILTCSFMPMPLINIKKTVSILASMLLVCRMSVSKSTCESCGLMHVLHMCNVHRFST